jgi:hypothetical protein
LIADRLILTFYVDVDLNGLDPCTNIDDIDTGEGLV